MKKLIIKTNRWYDNLPEPKRILFFLIFIMGTLIIAEYIMYFTVCYFAIAIWAFVIGLWRLTYFFINEKIK